jgi:hypothetical protein
LVPPALLKLLKLLRLPALRRAFERMLASLASAWVAVNNAWIFAVRPGRAGTCRAWTGSMRAAGTWWPATT